MIQPQTLLNVADNSGAQELMCIRIKGTGNVFVPPNLSFLMHTSIFVRTLIHN
ncbi:hypothetical protein KSP40_PGU013886 [Platanthera guangdongensis]|uniref:Ribosomal protein L14 n=1 Tax=Platanthera guangdongensis TaxID=2320717 RepID=A0ABR2MD42_9ASPA